VNPRRRVLFRPFGGVALLFRVTEGWCVHEKKLPIMPQSVRKGPVNVD
jgi:hypothetical protein